MFVFFTVGVTNAKIRNGRYGLLVSVGIWHSVMSEWAKIVQSL